MQTLSLIQPVLHGQLLWLVATLAAYAISVKLFQLSNHHSLLNPLLISILLLIGLLAITHTPYSEYRDGSELINFLLGPATVALAVPLYEYRQLLVEMWLPLVCALVVGSLVTIGSVSLLGHWLGFSLNTLLSLAPKAVTTPIALGIVQSAGGNVPLMVVFTMVTGIIGAIFGLTYLRAIRIKDPVISGFTMGLGASGIGTARCFEENEEMGAFAGLAVGLNGVFTALVVPVLIHFHLFAL